MKLRDLHALVDSGELRIRSLTLGPNCHVGRVRAKRVAGLVTVGMLESLDMGGSGCLRSAGVSALPSHCWGSTLHSANYGTVQGVCSFLLGAGEREGRGVRSTGPGREGAL